jgi:hypothetical protein
MAGRHGQLLGIEQGKNTPSAAMATEKSHPDHDGEIALLFAHGCLLDA